MSNDIAISVKNVGKAYRIWGSPAARLTAPLLASLSRLFPGAFGQWLLNRGSRSYRDFWALKEISFEVRKGESIGIIGRNGSGKSTLLQIIAGTLQPTEGSVKVEGRVAALLELGAGFNPEFTGRENVYLNGAILGLTRDEVDERFDRIASFADIGDFIDQPVKTYSSGMVVRLAFAVQIQLDPEILIVDEALAVGDEPFQRKCFSQIALMQERGVTILFVSHAAATVVELCQRAVLLDHGSHLLTARPKTAVQHYYQLCYAPADQLSRVRADIAAFAKTETTGTAAPSSPLRAEVVTEKPTAYFLESMQPSSRSEFPSQGALIESIQIIDSSARPVNVLVKGDAYLLRCRVHFTQTVARVRFGWTAKTLTGLIVSGIGTHSQGEGVASFAAGTVINMDFSFRCLFNPGTYFVDVGVRAELSEPDLLIHGINDALMFKVQSTPRSHRNGYVDTSIEPAWAVTFVPTNPT